MSLQSTIRRTPLTYARKRTRPIAGGRDDAGYDDGPGVNSRDDSDHESADAPAGGHESDNDTPKASKTGSRATRPAAARPLPADDPFAFCEDSDDETTPVATQRPLRKTLSAARPREATRVRTAPDPTPSRRPTAAAAAGSRTAKAAAATATPAAAATPASTLQTGERSTRRAMRAATVASTPTPVARPITVDADPAPTPTRARPAPRPAPRLGSSVSKDDKAVNAIDVDAPAASVREVIVLDPETDDGLKSGGPDFYEPQTPLGSPNGYEASTPSTTHSRITASEADAWSLLDKAAGLASPRKKRTKIVNKLARSTTKPPTDRPESTESAGAAAASKTSAEIAQTPVSEEQDEAVTTMRRPPVRPASASKLTYSAQRSFLDESALSFLDDLSAPTSRAVEADSGSEEDDIKVKSIHELRESGQNSRFLDEVEYLLDGIRPGAALASRRTTYLELATKLADKTFFNKFKATEFAPRLFMGLADETDEVAMFALGYIVCLFTQDDGVLSALADEHGGVRFLARLLANDTAISAIAKRKSNGVTRIGQSLVSELEAKIVSSARDDGAPAGRVSLRFLGLSGLLELSGRLPLASVADGGKAAAALLEIVASEAPLVAAEPDARLYGLHMALAVLENAGGGVGLLPLAARPTALVGLLGAVPQVPALAANRRTVAVALAVLRVCIVASNSAADLARAPPDGWPTDALGAVYKAVTEVVAAAVLPGADEDAANVALFALGLVVNLAELDAFVGVAAADLVALTSLFDPAAAAPDVHRYLALAVGSVVRAQPGARATVPAATLFALGRALEDLRGELDAAARDAAGAARDAALAGADGPPRASSSATPPEPLSRRPPAEQFASQIGRVIDAIYGNSTTPD
ncbi:wings apart-like protein regulation of heterochromatin-domain-containing protein [Dipodascopsis tothii]|uniref:wings apart-like protein regulation of heterochromatin-domain-containing protein n=1 Tax=Dipodascopsis tothii TaxID=44089 RepID=UPI0034CF8BB1